MKKKEKRQTRKQKKKNSVDGFLTQPFDYRIDEKHKDLGELGKPESAYEATYEDYR